MPGSPPPVPNAPKPPAVPAPRGAGVAPPPKQSNRGCVWLVAGVAVLVALAGAGVGLLVLQGERWAAQKDAANAWTLLAGEPGYGAFETAHAATAVPREANEVVTGGNSVEAEALAEAMVELVAIVDAEMLTLWDFRDYIQEPGAVYVHRGDNRVAVVFQFRQDLKLEAKNSRLYRRRLWWTIKESLELALPERTPVAVALRDRDDYEVMYFGRTAAGLEMQNPREILRRLALRRRLHGTGNDEEVSDVALSDKRRFLSYLADGGPVLTEAGVAGGTRRRG